MDHLLSCNYSTEVSTSLLQCLANIEEITTPEEVVNLNIKTSEAVELPLVWLVATCLMYICKERIAGKQARLVKCRTELLARLSIIRQTKWKHYTLHNSAVLLDEMINLHFC